MKALSIKLQFLFFVIVSGTFAKAQFKTKEDSLDYEMNYKKYFDCKYEPGNVLIIQRKGKSINPAKSWKPTKEGFVIRMEGIYDLEFTNGKRYKSGH